MTEASYESLELGRVYSVRWLSSSVVVGPIEKSQAKDKKVNFISESSTHGKLIYKSNTSITIGTTSCFLPDGGEEFLYVVNIPIKSITSIV